MKKIILDLSQHNGYVDFEKMKASGIDSVILRLGWIGNRNNHTMDSRFIQYYQGAKNNGFKVGCYVYNYCINLYTLKTGIDWILKQLKDYKLSFELPIFLDMEDRTISGCGKNLLTDMSVKFCEEITRNGLIAGVYANLNWWKLYLDVEKLKNYKIWLAQYTSKENHSANFKVDLWQFTDCGKVSGISGNVDMSYCLHCENVNEKEITGRKSNEEIADEVIQGLWETGDKRKELLTNSGYNYNDIQKIVNEKLSNQNLVKLHHVKKGETLSKIAKQYNTTVSELIKLNSIKNKNLIKVGQILKIKE